MTQGKGASPTNHSWYQSSRAIALSCGIKISVVRHLVLSQYTRVTDRRTDGRTDGQTDRITTPKTALAYARAVKTADRIQIPFGIIGRTRPGMRQVVWFGMSKIKNVG